MEPFGSDVLWRAAYVTFGTSGDSLKTLAITLGGAVACWYLLKAARGINAAATLAVVVSLSCVFGFSLYQAVVGRDTYLNGRLAKADADLRQLTRDNTRLWAELHPPVELHERNSEQWSWNGQRYPPGGFRLDGATPLEVTVGQFQRLNAAAKTPNDMTLAGVVLRVRLPRGFEVRHGNSWTPAGQSADGKASYSAPIGTIERGAMMNPREAFYFKAPEPGQFFIGYDISSFNAPPVAGGFPIVAKGRVAP